jgi:hypothetical protein
MWSRLVLAVVMTGISASDGLSATEELPKSCSRADVEKYGRPVIFERQRGIAFGVSACELTFLQKIQVFNSSGLPLERAAHKRLRDEGKSDNDLVVACSCSTVLTVEPGSRQVVDQGTINRKDVAYELPPGHYTIRERQQGGTSPDPASRSAKAAGLNIVVDEQ